MRRLCMSDDASCTEDDELATPTKRLPPLCARDAALDALCDEIQRAALHELPTTLQTKT